MLERVWKKVEHVRAQPEHVRLRYVLVCLAVSMVFILGIWFLSLKESVMNASRDLPKPSDAKLFPEGRPSLKDLIEIFVVNVTFRFSVVLVYWGKTDIGNCFADFLNL